MDGLGYFIGVVIIIYYNMINKGIDRNKHNNTKPFWKYETLIVYIAGYNSVRYTAIRIKEIKTDKMIYHVKTIECLNG